MKRKPTRRRGGGLKWWHFALGLGVSYLLLRSRTAAPTITTAASATAGAPTGNTIGASGNTIGASAVPVVQS